MSGLGAAEPGPLALAPGGSCLSLHTTRPLVVAGGPEGAKLGPRSKSRGWGCSRFAPCVWLQIGAWHLGRGRICSYRIFSFITCTRLRHVLQGAVCEVGGCGWMMLGWHVEGQMGVGVCKGEGCGRLPGAAVLRVSEDVLMAASRRGSSVCVCLWPGCRSWVRIAGEERGWGGWTWVR